MGERSTDSKLFTVPGVCNVSLGCSYCPDDSVASSGNSSNSASETDSTTSIILYHKILKLIYLFEIPDEPPCYKPRILSCRSCDTL